MEEREKKVRALWIKSETTKRGEIRLKIDRAYSYLLCRIYASSCQDWDRRRSSC